MILYCESCKTKFKAKTSSAQQKFLCPNCKAVLIPTDLTESEESRADEHQTEKKTHKSDILVAIEKAAPPLPDEVARAAANPQNIVNKYILVKKLGEGGMGVVFKAYDKTLNRFVAIKFLKGVSESEINRFIREAQIIASLDHPNIIPVYDVGTHEDRHYIVMKYIEGESIEKKNIGLRKSLEAISQVADALQHAHNKGVTHRDIKPSNILLSKDGRFYITDFGIAKQTSTTPQKNAYTLTVPEKFLEHLILCLPNKF